MAALALPSEPACRVYVTPLAAADRARVKATQRVKLLAGRWPGLTVEDQGSRLRSGNRIHPVNDVLFFLELAEEGFAGYIRNPGTLPKWEKPNMLVKYYVTTRGVETGPRQ